MECLIDLFSCLDKNKEWVFSGLGVTALLILAKIIFGFLGKMPSLFNCFSSGSSSPSASVAEDHLSNDISLGVLGILRKLVCAIQGNYVEFAYFSAEFHKELSESLEKGDVEEIARNLDELENYVDYSILDGALIVFDGLKKYFDGRHPVLPRCCVKVIREIQGQKYVSAYARDQQKGSNTIYRSAYPLHSHSAFKTIEGKGKGLVLNNIPEASARTTSDRYENERIKEGSARQYWEKWGQDQQSMPYPDKEWMECWLAEQDGAPNRFLTIDDPLWCYKSALVVPITLRGNTLKDQFRNDFNMRLRRYIPDGEVDRYIFGFLCVDHVDVDYFIDDFGGGDMSVGYIAADLLSLYMLRRLLLIDTSETFIKAKEKISDAESGKAKPINRSGGKEVDKFEVFLSHNSKDKPKVRELKGELEKRGITVWYDEDQLIPGRPWQPLLEEGINKSSVGAVLVGNDGLGPWENQEMQALLSQAVESGKAVIPVLLPDAPSQPSLPLFLRNFGWVDLRPSFSDAGIKKLIWGITGRKPA